jgi:ketosteroid isomerase-like protein
MKHVLAALLLGLCSTSAFADPADDVRCREIGFSQSVEEQDTEAFRSFIDTDARFVGNSVVRGVDAVVEAWAVFFTAEGPIIKWRPQIIEVLDNGTLALSRGPYRVITRNAEGKTVENWGTFNSIWRLNDDGQWRVVFDAGNPAATAPDDATKALLDADEGCQ